MSLDEKKERSKLSTHEFGWKLLNGDADLVFKGYLKEKLIEGSENFSYLANMTNTGFNFYKYIITQVSKIYDGDMVRKASDSSPILERYNDLGFDHLMQEANFYANGLGFCLLHIGYLEQEGLTYNIYTPNHFTYEIDEDNELTKIDITVRVSEESRKVKRWVILGNQAYYQVVLIGEVNEEILESVELPYFIKSRSGKEDKPFLPFVILNTKENINGQLLIEDNNDLYFSTMDIYWYLTLLKVAITKDILKKPYISGSFDPKQIPKTISGNYFDIIKIASDDKIEAGYLTADYDIEKLQKVITSEMVKVMASFGVSADKFSLTNTSSSGISIKLSNYGIIEIRKRQVPIWRKHEKKIFKRSNHIALAHGGKGDEHELKIDFGDISLPKSLGEVLKEETLELANGTTSPVHLIMKRYGMNEEEALKYHKKVKDYSNDKEEVIHD